MGRMPVTVGIFPPRITLPLKNAKRWRKAPALCPLFKSALPTQAQNHQQFSQPIALLEITY